jgi:transcriptional regulator with XRE-family HTH domain
MECISRQKLAELAGLHQTAVGLIERGLRSPNLDSAHSLAGALGMNLSNLIRETEKEHRKLAKKNRSPSTHTTRPVPGRQKKQRHR